MAADTAPTSAAAALGDNAALLSTEVWGRRGGGSVWRPVSPFGISRPRPPHFPLAGRVFDVERGLTGGGAGVAGAFFFPLLGCARGGERIKAGHFLPSPLSPLQDAALVDALLAVGQAHLFADWPPLGKEVGARERRYGRR